VCSYFMFSLSNVHKMKALWGICNYSCFISDTNDEFRLHFKLGWGVGVYSKVIGRILFRFVSNVTHVK